MEACVGWARGAGILAAWCGALAVAVIVADVGASGAVQAGSACLRCGASMMAFFGG